MHSHAEASGLSVHFAMQGLRQSSLLLLVHLLVNVCFPGCEAFHIVMQGLSESVVVEPYQASSECVEFSVTVLGSSKGPVVLLPTEVESYDMEDDLLEAALDFEAYKARQEVAYLLDLFLLLLLLLLPVLPMQQLFFPPSHLFVLLLLCVLPPLLLAHPLILLPVRLLPLPLRCRRCCVHTCLVSFVPRSGVLPDVNLHDCIVGALRTKKRPADQNWALGPKKGTCGSSTLPLLSVVLFCWKETKFVKSLALFTLGNNILLLTRKGYSLTVNVEAVITHP